MINTANKRLLCEPFGSVSAKTQLIGKVTRIEQHLVMAEATVAFGDAEGVYPQGTRIWLHGDAPKGLENAHVSLADKEYVIVPTDMVIAFERPAPVRRPLPPPTRDPGPVGE